MPDAVRRFAASTVVRLSMPLLWKELAEGAARPRTYVLRVVYAMALYGLFAFALPRLTDSRYYRGGPSFPSSTELLGFGSWIFERLQSFQLWGIILFQPALMCGRITQEKERDSLVLLFLTELRPWEIVLQKYIGGLVPMLSFLFLSLPLAGVAYALGGLESATIVDVALGLVLTVLQVGALALLFSAWCRTTVAALISTYFWGALLYFIPPILGRIMFVLLGGSISHFRSAPWQEDERWKLLNPTDGISLARGLNGSLWLYLLPSIGTILLCLGLTRWFLVRRAFVPPSNFLPRLFSRIDRWMKGVNRLAGGLVLYRESSSLPVTEPVFWRETQRRVLGKAHYLVRLLCAIEVPTVLLLMALLMVFGDGYETGGMLAFATAVLVGLAVLTLSTTASNSLVSERVGQTLDVLLTTPVSAREIVRQKERALRRLEWVLVVPLLTVFSAHAFFLTSSDAGQPFPRDWIPYLVCWVLTLVIYLPMITWLSLWIGLRVRTRFQGILITLSVLIFWMVALPFTIVMTAGRLGFNPEDSIWALLASPLSVPFLNEAGELQRIAHNSNEPDMIWQIILINSALYAGIAFLIRFCLFREADRCLRR
ncbi:hypothetical protein CfE428DRAFT_5163 [Chthoniobacter flavus Ellin428]|uniref:ABC-2 type transporter n=1 Tax=Chthoniobacter flavus Ellin428 TaxID=497964 RepID=B4D8C3_9BACT|nr:ABC transporter permease subunit [Chthoniobacter flavus]EDY17316.1 hypothetical protein CfE428DRAFT_5163 [Chthoniobacter flavus Ellin428]TCO90113.1 ABC-2 family transporter [Chthoniobacter flavus]